MGVKNLWQLLLPIGRTLSIESLGDKTLAIDASIWLVQFVKAMRDPNTGEMIPSAHLLGSFRRILKLLYHKIRPVFVFDGVPPQVKMREMARRNRQKADADEDVKKTARRILVNQLREKELQKKQSRVKKNPEKAELNDEVDREIESFATANSAMAGGFIGGGDFYDVGDPFHDPTNRDRNNRSRNREMEKVVQKEVRTQLDNHENSSDDSDGFIDWESGDAPHGAQHPPNSNFVHDAYVPTSGTLDLSVAFSLPHSMRIDVIEKAKANMRVQARKEFMPVASDPRKFSEVQMGAYLRQGAMNRMVLEMGKKEVEKNGGNGGGGSAKEKEKVGKRLVLDDSDDDDSDDSDAGTGMMGGTGFGLGKKITMYDSDDDYSDNAHGIGKETETENEMSGGGIIRVDENNRIHDDPPQKKMQKHIEQIQEEGDIESDNNDSNDEFGQLGSDSDSDSDNSSLVGMEGIDSSNSEREDNMMVLNDESFARKLQSEEFGNGNAREGGGGGGGGIKLMRAERDKNKVNVRLEKSKSGSGVDFVSSFGAMVGHVDVEVTGFSSCCSSDSDSDSNSNSNSNSKMGGEIEQDADQNLLEEWVDEEEEKEEKEEELKTFASLETSKGNNNCDGNDDTLLALAEAQDNASRLTSWAGRVVKKAINEHLEMEENFEEKGEIIDSQIAEYDKEDAEVIAAMSGAPPSPSSPSPPPPPSQTRTYDEMMAASKQAAETAATAQLQLIQDSIDLETVQRNQIDLKAHRNRQARDASHVTTEMKSELIAMLGLFGLPYVLSPGEAEAQCAELERLNLVDGIVTEDSDVFVFGGRNVYRNIFEDLKNVECYFARDAEAELDLGKGEFVALAMLLGGDYSGGVKGVGPVNGMEILAAFPVEEEVEVEVEDDYDGDGDDVVIKKRRRTDDPTFALSEFGSWLSGFDPLDLLKKTKKIDTKKMNLRQVFHQKHKSARTNWEAPSDFPAKDALKAYMKPNVDSSRKEFSWGEIDVEGLGEFCSGFVPNFDDVIGPVVNQIKRKADGQTTLESYFTRYEDDKRFASVKSKRLRAAIKIKTGGKSKAPGVAGHDGDGDVDADAADDDDEPTKKKPKTTRKIKNARTAFSFFATSLKKSLKAQDGNINIGKGELNKRVSAAWQVCNDDEGEELSKCKELAKEDKKRYLKEKKEELS